MIQKETKYILHYDDVRGDFLRAPQGTTPAIVEEIISQKLLSLETKNAENHKNIGEKDVYNARTSVNIRRLKTCEQWIIRKHAIVWH